MIIIGLDQYLICNSKKVTKAAWSEEPEPWRLKSGQCAYWRKANQIHNWFVENCQNGNDDCGTHYVEVEQLQELLHTVRKVLGSTKLVKGRVANGYRYVGGEREYIWQDGMVLEDSTVAEELLPTQQGFFFGGTHYDQWYWEDLEWTEGQLARILDAIEKVRYRMFDDGDYETSDWMAKGDTDWVVTFQYQSSW